MSVEAPNPFLDRASAAAAVRVAMAGSGMRMAYVRPSGEEIRPDKNGALHFDGQVSSRPVPSIDWASVTRFTRAK